ncbi:MAG: hypothetical protein AAGD96_03340 [Chloroflexota bacterium]
MKEFDVMKALFLLFLAGSAAGAILVLSVLIQFRQYELAQKRTLDLNILAFERDLDFQPIHEQLDQILVTNMLAFNQGEGRVHNVISQEYPHGVATIFDYSYDKKGLKKRLVTLKGIMFKFNHRRFPSFQAIKKKYLSKQEEANVDIGNGLQNLMFENTAVLTGPAVRSWVKEILLKNRIIKEFALIPTFSALFFHGRYVVIYFDAVYLAKADLLAIMLERAELLSSLKS